MVAARAQQAVAAGAIEAVVAAIRAHAQAALVQQGGYVALMTSSMGNDALVAARRQRAVAAGAIEAVVAGMQAHPDDGEVQDLGQRVRDLLQM